MKRLIALLLAAVAALTGCSALSSSGDGYERISPEEALARMQSEQDYIILDVRTEAEYAAGIGARLPQDWRRALPAADGAEKKH